MADVELPPVKLEQDGDETTLVCPHCGTKGVNNFVYAEDAVLFRELIETDGAMIVIRQHYDVNDEDGNNPRLGCKKCDKECVIPEEIEYDFR
jgi:hypothetical protein